MTTEATPGPWKIEKLEGTLRQIVDANGGHITWAVHPLDAALISAAPELLEACLNAERAMIERSRATPGVWDGALAQLQTALQKAGVTA